jgi:hypothetical protein
LPEARAVRQREAKEVFDFAESQHHGVRVSAVQKLVQRPVFGWHGD